MSEQRWMRSGFLKGAPSGAIDADKGVIEGVSVVTAGEAKGHGVNLDSEFVADVVEMGNEKRQGLKARYGHPNMSSTALGTFIGRFKNFRRDGEQARADLFLSNEARETPHGDLHSYVMGMAKNEPDMFGTSIVFTPGKEYVRGDEGEKIYDFYSVDPITGIRFAKSEYEDLPIFVECEALHGCDAVDEPAANDGLFSAFSKETVAGQITQFLDLHPEAWQLMQGNPAIIETLAKYGDKMDGFISRYRQYREQQEEPMKDEQTAAEPEDKTLLSAETEETTESPEEAPAEPDATEEAPAEPEDETPPEEEPAEAMSREEFTRIADEFGAEIAAQTMKDGGNYESALNASHDALKADNEALRKQVAELESTGTGKPAKVTAAPADGKGGRMFGKLDKK